MVPSTSTIRTMLEGNANVANGLNELFHFACSVSKVGNGLPMLGAKRGSLKKICHFFICLL